MRKQNKIKPKKQSKVKRVIDNRKRPRKRKILEVEVLSNKMQNTVVVKLINKKAHPLYKKIIKKSRKYKAHTDKDLSVGDIVKIEQCRPVSKEKRWKVIKVVAGSSKK